MAPATTAPRSRECAGSRNARARQAGRSSFATTTARATALRCERIPATAHPLPMQASPKHGNSSTPDFVHEAPRPAGPDALVARRRGRTAGRRVVRVASPGLARTVEHARKSRALYGRRHRRATAPGVDGVRRGEALGARPARTRLVRRARGLRHAGYGAGPLSFRRLLQAAAGFAAAR